MYTHYLFRSGNPDLDPVLLLHSTGGDENQLLQLADTITPDHPVLSIRGRISEQGLNRYFERYAEGDFNLESLEKESDWLLDQIIHLAQKFDLDLSKMVVIGYSNGANMALHLALSKPVTFGKVIAHHAMQLTEVPVATDKLAASKIFLSFGEHDSIVPKSTFIPLVKNLGAAGADVEIHTESGGHQLTRSEISAAKEWLENV